MALGRKEVFTRIMLLMAGAIAYGLAFPPYEFAWLAWLAPVAWLAVLQDVEQPRRRFWLMFAIGYIGSLMIIYWLTALFSALAVILWMVPAMYFGLWGAVVGLYRHGPLWLRILWPAVTWVAIEYIRCELAPLAFSFGNLGSSQTNAVGFRLASVVGVYGVSGIMVLLGSVLVEAWQARHRLRWVAAGGIGIIAGAAFVPAAMPLPGNDEILGRAILQQLDQEDDIAAWEVMPRRAETADLIVWPELTFADDPDRIQAGWFVDMMRVDAARSNWGNIFGAVQFPHGSRDVNDPFYNTAYLMNSRGNIIGSGSKNQPVQLMNDGMPADDVSVLDVGSSETGKLLKMGLGVCYDGCFQRYSRRMVAKGADFLVFPTMNVELWGTIQHLQHQRLFQMRAAETGRTVLVAAVSGPTFAAQPGGASGDRAPFHQTATVEANIQAPRQTLFNLGGWLTGPVCLVVTMLGLIWRSGGRMRTIRTTDILVRRVNPSRQNDRSLRNTGSADTDPI